MIFLLIIWAHEVFSGPGMESPPSSLDAILTLLLAKALHIKGPITQQEKALCWPVNVEEHPVDSLLCTAEEERSARFIRYPAPIMPISRNRKRQRKEDDDAAMDSFEEDSEIDEILAGRPSPSTPFEHSPILYKRLELLFNRKCQVNVDESFRRNVIMGITRKLGNILEMSRELHRALEGDGAVAGNGQFVLELARVAAIPETVIESAEARFKSAIQALNERPT